MWGGGVTESKKRWEIESERDVLGGGRGEEGKKREREGGKQ